jgi:hypothetical protein
LGGWDVAVSGLCQNHPNSLYSVYRYQRRPNAMRAVLMLMDGRLNRVGRQSRLLRCTGHYYASRDSN